MPEPPYSEQTVGAERAAFSLKVRVVGVFSSWWDTHFQPIKQDSGALLSAPLVASLPPARALISLGFH